MASKTPSWGSKDDDDDVCCVMACMVWGYGSMEHIVCSVCGVYGVCGVSCGLIVCVCVV